LQERREATIIRETLRRCGMRVWAQRGVILACACSLLMFAGRTLAGDAAVERGVREVESGDYDAAIVTLDAAARRLSKDPGDGQEIGRAYLYLGIAFVGKGHEAAAKARFRQAVRRLRGLSLSAEEFPPKIIGLFEAAREEELAAEADSSAPEQRRPPSPQVSGSTEKKGGGGKKLLFIGGGLALAGGGVAVAAGGGGGGGNGGPNTPTTPPSVRATFTPERVALPHVTTVTFSAVANNLTSPAFTWDFGDGVTAEGPEATHVYVGNGDFRATVTAHGPEGQPQATVTVSVRDVTGRWEQINPVEWKDTLRLEQQNRRLAGTWIHTNLATGESDEIPLTGQLSSPDQVSVREIRGCLTELNGTFNPEVVQLSAEAHQGAVCGGGAWELTLARQ